MVNPLAPCFEWFLGMADVLSFSNPYGSFLTLVITCLVIISIVRWFS